MFKKILWATNGSKNRVETQRYVELLANKFKSKVYAINVVPEYKNFVEAFSEEDGNRFSNWVENTLIPNEKNLLDSISKEFQQKGINSEISIMKGIPSQKILDAVDKFGIDLIVLGKGRAGKRTLLGGTALKVLRNSKIPVLIIGEEGTVEISNILAPNDLNYLPSTNLHYAADLAMSFDSKIYNLNVVEIGDYKFPQDLIDKMKANSYLQMTKNLEDFKLPADIETTVEADKNAWEGIINCAREKKADLIIMNTHGGDQYKNEFIGSVTEKVVQEAICPVLTMKS